jgi:DNA-binding Lrp family transcriptional regulator
MVLNSTDRKILNALLSDCRLSYRRIGRRLGLSAATVMNRMKKLEKEGIIKRYTAVLDYEKLGYDIHVIIELRISKGKLFEVEKKIAAHPNVMAVYDQTGPFDAAVIARFKSKAAMDRFLKQIQTYTFVERTETKLVLNTLKEKFIGVR